MTEGIAPKRKELFEGVEIEVGVSSNGGYKHWRSRREIIASALQQGIPAYVVLHPELMGSKTKPSNLAYKRIEKLLVAHRQMQESGQNPSSLWEPYQPKPTTDDPACP